MMTGRIQRVAGLILSLSVVLSYAGAVQAQTLEEIVDGSLEATGGRDAIGSVESVRQTGTFTMSTPFGDLEGDFENLVIPNQKLYQSFDSDLFQQRTGWNGLAAWQSDNTQGVVDVTGAQLAALVAQSSLHPFWDYGSTGPFAPTYSRLDDVELNGRNHHRVQASWQGVDFRVLVDAETLLVSRIQFSQEVPGVGTVAVTADASDYEEHGGVVWSASNTVEVQGAFRIDMRIDSVEINGEVDHNVFEKP
jgi:hypothetical protein